MTRLPRSLILPPDHEIVAGLCVAVEGNRVRIRTDDGDKEVEVRAGHRFRVGADVRVYGLVKLCTEWCHMPQAVAR